MLYNVIYIDVPQYPHAMCLFCCGPKLETVLVNQMNSSHSALALISGSKGSARLLRLMPASITEWTLTTLPAASEEGT